MYSKGGGGGEHDDDSEDCTSGGGGGMLLLVPPPEFPIKGDTEVLVTEDSVRTGLTAKGLGMGLGNCLSFVLYDDKFVGREETRKASGGVTDLVSSLGL